MPERVQLRRVKGWRLPAGVVNVARPTKWGNPYKAGTRPPLWPASRPFGRTEAANAYLLMVAGGYEYRQDPGLRIVREAIAELAGRDLACWCPLSARCHADVLLVYANLGAGLPDYTKWVTGGTHL